jgi:hypothetical protein
MLGLLAGDTHRCSTTNDGCFATNILKSVEIEFYDKFSKIKFKHITEKLKKLLT